MAVNKYRLQTMATWWEVVLQFGGNVHQAYQTGTTRMGKLLWSSLWTLLVLLFFLLRHMVSNFWPADEQLPWINILLQKGPVIFILSWIFYIPYHPSNCVLYQGKLLRGPPHSASSSHKTFTCCSILSADTGWVQIQVVHPSNAAFEGRLCYIEAMKPILKTFQYLKR